ncbi:MAG: xanthine dehydrogenase family protein subunit M [Bacteroidetes bacterium]|nr:MAG: xanthine dehydrogenase family protein subunit M [Bacteroidota bacterium]
MIPEPFEYSAPTSLSEALTLLRELGDEAKILAGGHSLIPMMKLRFATPTHLVDLNRVPGLSYVTEENGVLRIGAMTREHELDESPIVAEKFPIFRDAARLIADPQVRNFGTVGGNLAHGDAANDQPAVMIALNAEVVIASLDGERTVPIDDFFYGFYMTAVQEGEILTEIRVPIQPGRTGNAYHKSERKVGDYATAGVAVQVSLDDDGVCTYAGIGLTNVNPTPMRARRSEEALLGRRIDEDAIAAAARYAAEDCNPSDDLRGSTAYKRRLVRVLTQRMIHKALERAHGRSTH